MDKAAQLQSVLGRLSATQATQLARTVELERALGRDGMPSTPILEALRPVLRVAKPPRVPTLHRLVCAGIEEFLSDRSDEPRLEGLIPRTSLTPWWQAATLVAGPEIAAFDARLHELLAGPAPNLEALQHEAQEAAARWSAEIGAELAKPKPPLALRQLLPALIARDVDMIAHALSVARPLGAAMKTLQRIAARLNVLEERRVTDLTPDCVTLLKKEYLALSESHGMDARFLALAVLNRLEQSRQILRLGRALSWKPDDSLVANTELFCVGARLIGEVERLARVLLARMPRRGPMAPAGELGAALVHYLDESEGVLSEIGVRRDSPWGAAILQTRSEIAAAITEEFLDRYAQQALAILPQAGRLRPDLTAAPGPVTVGSASEAADFLRLLTKRGQRHGFAQAALQTITALGDEIEDRIVMLCSAARETPSNHDVIEAQARAAANLCDVLFESGRSTALMRSVVAAMRGAAA
jgi:hypothetical protein